MRLKKFKITNFRSVEDSGWIDAEQVTALVGVNESGKTNLLLPLWKLNPAREGEIRPTSDFPKGNYAAIRRDPGSFCFVTAEFDCHEISDKISELSGAPASQVEKVIVERYLDGQIYSTFPDYVRINK
ncbi:AAA family ATPase, partial [Altererythrobacter sp. KTW20L]|uniref:AAA family ATPase n=1 Tax=Altererythrobacter sp. KTW20L TaxID=2942210 RepID=UPI0020C0B291